MAIAEIPTKVETFADLWDRLGNVSLERIRIQPLPGAATEADVVAARLAPERRLCELVEGVLVEKIMGTKEAMLALWIGHLLLNFLEENDLGIALGADGAVCLMPGLVRIPDVSFVSWSKLPGKKLPDQPIADLVPDLAVEVLSTGNTAKEMQRKLQEYYQAWIAVVWVVDPKTQTGEIITSPTDRQTIAADGELQAKTILPGFRVLLAELFKKVL